MDFMFIIMMSVFDVFLLLGDSQAQFRQNEGNLDGSAAAVAPEAARSVYRPSSPGRLVLLRPWSLLVGGCTRPLLLPLPPVSFSALRIALVAKLRMFFWVMDLVFL
jgi:hypothetical protein